MVLHKSWLCHHSFKNKIHFTEPTKGTGCKASVDIKVKKVNRNTKKNDHYLKLSPPLAAVIKIDLQHNHTTDSADALRCLKLNDEVVAEFHQYFSDGLLPGAAIRLHEDKLVTGDGGYQVLADGSVNPADRTVYHLYEQWRKANLGSQTSPLEMLKSKLQLYHEKGTECFVMYY